MNIYCFSTLSFAKLQFKSVINKAFHKHGVASFTDAWIETENWTSFFYPWTVASFTDAWIETRLKPCLRPSSMSHLLQMRGLKPNGGYRNAVEAASHLLQMRGLKLETSHKTNRYRCRIFYRCVDWNTISPTYPIPFPVASFTDAWIETVNEAGHTVTTVKSHLLQMRGLKLWWGKYSDGYYGRIFYRCVDWNRHRALLSLKFESRIFYRCVDWNF